MALIRSLVVSVLVLLLTVSLVGANLVTVGGGTVLDPGFVKETLEEEDAYGLIQEEALSVIGSDGGGDLPDGTGELVKEVVTEEYLQSEVERNVDSAYGYLHGDREELVLGMDMVPLKESASTTLETRVQERGVIDLLSSSGDVGSTVDMNGVSLDSEVLGRMPDNETSYQEGRAAFRESVRDAAVEGLVTEAFDAASNDQLLLLVVDGYNPLAYSEAEKQAMVDAREEEIRAELRTTVEATAGDEIDQAVESRMGELRSAMSSELGGSIPSDELTPEADDAAMDLVQAYVDGLTTDLAYGEFRSRVMDARGRLATEVSVVADTQLTDSVPDRIDLAEDLDPAAEQGLRDAREAVGVMDQLRIVLPLAALAIVGFILLVSRSVVVTLLAAGSSLVVSGVSGYATATVGEKEARRMVAEMGPDVDAVNSLVLGFVERVLGELSSQSLLLAGVGVVLLVGALVYRVVFQEDAAV